MEITYRYQAEDFEELFEEINRRFPRTRRLRQQFLGLGIVLCLLPFLASASLAPERDLLWAIPFGGWLVCVGWPISVRKVARRQCAKATFDYDYTATITDAGIVTKSPTVRTELQWAAFSRYYKTENLLALLYDNVTYMFPRRAFLPQEWQEFAQMVERNVKRKATS